MLHLIPKRIQMKAALRYHELPTTVSKARKLYNTLWSGRCGKRNPCTSLVGVQIGAISIKRNLTMSMKKFTCVPTAKHCKQPECPLLKNTLITAHPRNGRPWKHKKRERKLFGYYYWLRTTFMILCIANFFKARHRIMNMVCYHLYF